MSWLRAVVVLVVLLLLAAPARAHQSSFSYATLEITGDGKGADYEIRLSSRDLFEALELDEDRDASDPDIRDGAAKLSHYVLSRVHIEGTGKECLVKPQGVQVVRQGERFAQVKAELRCKSRVEVVEILYELFFDLDPRHEGLLTVDGQLVQLSSDRRSFRFEPEHPTRISVWGFLRSGINHVLFGLDHVLFLLSLLLVVGLRRSGELLTARTPWHSLRRTAGIVSAFTLGHSMTLIVAALGIVSLSSRFVESMIAASIVYVAIENLVRPDPPWRALVGFGFGLMHGLGFAAMLRPLLSPGDTVLPLLVFNLGVEIGQLFIVVLALPLLLLVIVRLGASTYRSKILPPLCVLLAVMGLLWLAERALEIEIVGF